MLRYKVRWVHYYVGPKTVTKWGSGRKDVQTFISGLSPLDQYIRFNFLMTSLWILLFKIAHFSTLKWYIHKS